MDRELALEKSRKLGISVVQIVREEYEVVLLQNLFDSFMASRLVFRGGTALRLAYGSPRFSDDLDFTQLKTIELKKFQTWCQEVSQDNSYLKLDEAVKKKYTLLAIFKVIDPVLSQTISIKLEISVRKQNWQKEKDFQLISLKSQVTPLTVLAQVASLEWIEKEKLSIKPPRVRDVFDLWFISQKLNKDYQVNFGQFKTQEVKRELNRLLPLGSRRLIESWLIKK